MKKRNAPISQVSYGLSTGDLMAALLMIFVLLLIGTILKLQEDFESKSRIAENYRELQVELYTDLKKEFEDDFKRWDAEIDSSLAIRFIEPKVLFDSGSSRLKPQFANILNDFFPRYLTVLRAAKYVNHIEEIRIEGHTTSTGRAGMDVEDAYFYNMGLSQQRTRSVLEYSMRTVPPDAISWTRGRTTANGLSSSQPLLASDSLGLNPKNRRVEFRVKTDAEEQMRQMILIATYKTN